MRRKFEQTPLMRAAFKGDLAGVREELAKGADPNAQDIYGSTALHLALDADARQAIQTKRKELNLPPKGKQREVLEVIRILLEHGARTDIQNKNRITPASRVQYVCSRQAAELVLNYAAEDPAQREGLFAQAGTLLTPERLESLIQNGADINHAVELRGYSASPLAYAVIRGQRENVEILLKHGAKIDQLDSTGSTPLMLASYFENLPIVELLLAHGADANARNKRGETVLMASFGPLQERGRKLLLVPVLEILIKNGAKANELDAEGNSVLIIASGHRSSKAVKFLCEQGLDANHMNSFGETALTRATKAGRTENIRVLAQYGARGDIQDGSGNTALIYAAASTNGTVPDLISVPGTDVNHQNSFGETALMCAAAAGRVESINILAQHGARGEIQDSLGDTALMRAARCSFTDAVVRALMLVPGARVNQENRDGATAMDFVLLSQAEASRRPWASSSEGFLKDALKMRESYGAGTRIMVFTDGFNYWSCDVVIIDGKNYPGFPALLALRNLGGHFGNAAVRFWK